MALIRCPECGQAVSSTAYACPHCGFSVAACVQQWEKEQEELKRKQQREQEELERQLEHQRLVEEMERQAEEKRQKKAALRQRKAGHLNQYGGISFWIFAFAPVCSVVSVMLRYLQMYFIRRKVGLPVGDGVLDWLGRNAVPMLPMEGLAMLVVLLFPAILYVVANHIKKKKAAKILLLLAVGYHTVLFLLPMILDVIRGYIVTVPVQFLIPFCVYIVLYWKAVSLKTLPEEV